MANAGRVRRGARGWLAEAGDAVVNIFFPAGCRSGTNLLTGASRVPICDECLSSFELVPERRCETCGRPLPALTETLEERLLCPACQVETYAFERARSLRMYDGARVRAILLLKFERMSRWERGSRGDWRRRSGVKMRTLLLA